MLKLYDYFRSSAAFRVRIGLNLKAIPYESIPIHLLKDGGQQHSPSYRVINPQELVPALAVGDKIITQSLAILLYLDETYPKPSLFPADPIQKAQALSIASAIACDIHPFNNLRVRNYLNQVLSLSEHDEATWCQYWINKGFKALDSSLSQGKKEGMFAMGEIPSIADIYIYPQMVTAKRFGVDWETYPRLHEIAINCEKHPAFIQALPENQPDAS